MTIGSAFSITVKGLSRKETAVPDIPLGPVFRGYEGIGFRKLLVQ